MSLFSQILNYYYNLAGRISLKDYWLKVVLPLLGITILTSVLTIAFIMLKIKFLAVICFLIGSLVYTASFCPVIQRLHDRGKSGWFALIGLIPLVNLWIFVETFFIPGQKEENKYDADQVPSAKWLSPMVVASVLCIINLICAIPGLSSLNKGISAGNTSGQLSSSASSVNTNATPLSKEDFAKLTVAQSCTTKRYSKTLGKRKARQKANDVCFALSKKLGYNFESKLDYSLAYLKSTPVFLQDQKLSQAIWDKVEETCPGK